METMIMKGHRELELVDKDVQWAAYVAGQLEGRALALLDVLRFRGVEVDAASETRILACRDKGQLIAWLAGALTLDRVDELFEPE
jgi:hypothetical protein